MSLHLRGALAALVFFSLAPNAIAQSLVRIEEDWELHVVQPDEQLDAPQITTTMLPFGENSDLLFQLDINHASQPAFSAGGLQLRIGDGDLCLDCYRLQEGSRLYQSAETVSWTQVLQQVEGGFAFSVINGNSVSFGSFGGPSTSVFLANHDADGSTLNSYRIEDSAENSGVAYAGNRVGWLKLKRVRLTNSLGQQSELQLNLDVH